MNQRDRIFVLSHTSDIDGVGSAALLRMRFKMPLENILFSDYTDANVSEVTGRLRRMASKGITLFITDLGVGSRSERIFEDLVKRINENDGKVFWFDHHVWSDNGVRKIAARCEVAVVGENKDFCATEITRAMLRLNDKFTEKFVRIVHHSDFNLRPKDNNTRSMVGAYALSIASYNTLQKRKLIDKKLRHMVEVIAGGRLIDKRIASDAKRFEILNKKRVAFLLEHLYLGKNLAVAFTKERVQTTSTCMQIMAKSRKKVVVLVDLYNGTGHFRTDTYDISGIARSMKGGGHPHAAGFTIDMKKYGGFRSEDGKKRFVDMIDKQISALRPEN